MDITPPPKGQLQVRFCRGTTFSDWFIMLTIQNSVDLTQPILSILIQLLITISSLLLLEQLER